jgi:hypothetical protein
MLNKNSLLTGVLMALILPVVACAVAYLLKNNEFIINKPALPYFGALAINLVILRVYFKKGADKTGGGIIIATFVFMVLVFVFKIHPIR